MWSPNELSPALLILSSLAAVACEPTGEPAKVETHVAALRPKVATPISKPTPARIDIPLGGAPVRGKPAAPVLVVVYSDFECPYCARGAKRMEELLARWPEDVRVAFKHFPLAFHDHARPAALAAVAAGNQGRFWEMHDRLFAAQRELDDEALAGHAKALGLDLERFRRDLADPATQALVEADQAEGAARGVTGTPTFFVGGRRLVGAQPLEAFAPLVEQALAERARPE